LIVVDASALIDTLAVSPGRGTRERVRGDGDLRAPHVVDLEVLNSLRHLVLRGTVSADAALAIRSAFAEIAITRYPHMSLADRIWELRNYFSANDAAYVALAEALDAPLITCDARLANAGKRIARIELFEGK